MRPVNSLILRSSSHVKAAVLYPRIDAHNKNSMVYTIDISLCLIPFSRGICRDERGKT